MSPILAIALKDLRQLSRDKAGLFFVIGFPVLMALFFGSIFSGGGGASAALRIVVVDEDGSPLAAAFTRQLGGLDALRVTTSTLEVARDRVRRGEGGTVALVRVLDGFGDNYGVMGDGIAIAADPSRRAELGYLQGMVMQALVMTLQDVFADFDFARAELARARDALATSGTSWWERQALVALLGHVETFVDDSERRAVEVEEEDAADSAAGGAPADDATGFSFGVTIEDLARDRTGQPRSGYDITFPSSILWGVIGCVAAFSLSIVVERQRGTWLRLRMSPVPPHALLLGKGLACLLASLATIVLLLGLGIVFFGVGVGSWPLLLVAALATSACFVGAMMLVATFGKTEAAVGGAGWALFIVWMMLGGGMIPLIAMPAWMVTASHASPVKWGILALEGAVWRDFTPAQMATPVAILLTVGGVMFAAGWALLARRDRRGG